MEEDEVIKEPWEKETNEHGLKGSKFEVKHQSLGEKFFSYLSCEWHYIFFTSVYMYFLLDIVSDDSSLEVRGEWKGLHTNSSVMMFGMF